MKRKILSLTLVHINTIFAVGCLGSDFHIALTANILAVTSNAFVFIYCDVN